MPREETNGIGRPLHFGLGGILAEDGGRRVDIGTYLGTLAACLAPIVPHLNQAIMNPKGGVQPEGGGKPQSIFTPFINMFGARAIENGTRISNVVLVTNAPVSLGMILLQLHLRAWIDRPHAMIREAACNIPIFIIVVISIHGTRKTNLLEIIDAFGLLSLFLGLTQSG